MARRNRERARRPPNADRRPVLEPLEPRILLSTLTGAELEAAALQDVPQAAPADALVAAPDAELPQGDGALTSATSDAAIPDEHSRAPAGVAALRREIAILDPGVQNSAALRDLLAAQQEAGRDLELFVLDASRDGVEQIAEILASHQDLDAVHVLSHGTAEGLQLGSTWLDADTIDDHADAIRGWQTAFDSDADLLLYGCDLAASDAGKSLVDTLGQWTGTDVAASTDLTGTSYFGGDWDLEYRAGSIETAVAASLDAQRDWVGLMSVAVDATSTGTTTGTSLTISHTTSGTNRLMIVAVSLRETGTESVSSVTYKGTALTFNGFAKASTGARVEIWSLVDPSSGPHNVVITLSGAGGGATAGVMTFTGVDQTTPLGVFASASGGANNGSVSVSSAPGELVFGAVAVRSADQNLVPGAGQTERWDLFAGTEANGGASTEAGAESVDLSWTWSASTDWAIGAVAIKPAAFVVTNTNNTGAGSLRQAILDANASVGHDVIKFAIPGAGVHTIAPTSALPTISDGVTIDATTQPGFAGTPLIRLDGASAGAAVNGLTLNGTSDGSIVRGLMITRFTGDGIAVQSGADGVTIAGNWIGTTGAGSTGVGNADDGIDLAGSSAVIGGTGANDRNVITNSGDEGIDIVGSGVTAHRIQGNYIGVDPDGSSGGGNADVGIAIVSGSGNTIGGITPAARNVISRNYEGIEINTSNNVVQGNYIGTDASGTLDRGQRSDDGIEIQGSSTGNVIGGAVDGAGNLIAFNFLDGVNVVNGSGNQILRNSIHSNTQLGINLGAAGVTANDPPASMDGDAGANNLQNFPVLTSASVVSGTQVTVVGSLNSTANSYFRIEFFASPVADGSAHGEAQRYLGFANVTTNSLGNASFNASLTATVALGEFVTATATSCNSTFSVFANSSEFAQNVVATNSAPVLNPGRSPALIAVSEDSGVPSGAVGTLISSLVDFASPAGQVDNVTDADGGALLGIAVTAADTTKGTWWYSTDSGTTWTALGAVANNSARLLAADSDSRIHFQPNADYSGTLASAITFRAWDRSSGTNGSLSDTTLNGGTTPFSAATDTASLVVSPVNDAPVAADDVYSVDEDTTLVVGPSTANLVNWWKFDDGGASQTAVDSGSLALNGTLGTTAGVDTSDPTWTTGYAGANGLSFDGTGDYVSTNSTIAKTASSFTISAWFKADSTVGQHHILSQGYSGGNGYGDPVLNGPASSEMSLSIGTYNQDNKIVFHLGYDVPENGGNPIYIVSASNFTDTTQWHHAAVTVTSSGGVFSASLYVDGVLEGTDTGVENNRSQWGSLLIGRPSAPTRYFDGSVDEVRIYDTALSAAQVQSITQGGILANDSDIDSHPLRVDTGIVTGPANGTLSVSADGSFIYTPNSNFTGSDAFTYRATDGSVDSNVATVTITVNPVNDAPVLNSAASPTLAPQLEDSGAPSGAVGTLVASLVDFASPAGQVDNVTDADAGAKLGIAVTASDTTRGTWHYSTDNGATWSALGPVTNGSARLLAADGSTRLYFQPNANFNGTLAGAITFRAWDQTSGANGGLADASSNGGATAFSSVTDTANLTINPVNDPPVLSGIESTTLAYTENDPATAVTGTLTVSDMDNGTLISATVQITANYINGEDVLSFESTPGITGSWNSGTGTLTLSGTDTLANYQAAMRAVKYSNTSNAPTPAVRTVSITGNDGVANSNLATRNISVAPVNDAPVAANDTAVVAEGGAVTIDLAANDTDADSALNLGSIAIVSAPANGSLVLNGNGTVTYTHNGSETVSDAFTYTIRDASGATSDVATVSLTITPMNDAPVAVADSATVLEGASATINLAGNDTDAEGAVDPTSIVIVSAPANGSLVLNGDGTVTYTHDGSETASDSFTYTIRDASGEVSNVATVSLTVTPVNDAPVAVADSATLAEGASATIHLAGNDSDAEGALNLASIVIVSGPADGSVVVNGDGTVTYTHNGSETASDSFSYTIRDASGAVSNVATVSLTVTPVNDAPVASPDGAAVAEGGSVTLDLAANDTDVEGALDLSSIQIVSGPANGSVVVNGDGTLSYTHDGSETASDSFTYTIRDASGAVSGVATVSLTVTPVAPANDAPVAPPSPGTVEPPPAGPRVGDLGMGGTEDDGAGTDRAEAAAASPSTDRDAAAPPDPMRVDAGGIHSASQPSGLAGRLRGATWLARGASSADEPQPSADVAGDLGSAESTAREPDRDSQWERGGVDLAAHESLWLELDRLRRDLEEGRGDDDQSTLKAAVETIGIAFSGALLAMTLRSSALWAAALSSLPLWRRMDPLMVLGLSEDERRKLDEQQRDASRTEGAGVGRVLDGGRTKRSSDPS